MGHPVDEPRIDAAEAALGVTLPTWLRRALAADNGGQIEVGGDRWTLHPVRDDSDPRRIRRTWDDIVRRQEAARRWTGFPDEAIAIGENGTGDMLVMIDAGSGLEPAVWDHETGVVSPVPAPTT